MSTFLAGWETQSCWPELLGLAVDQLLVASSSLYLFLLGEIVPQQLLSVDKKCVLRLNHQLPTLLIPLHWVSATNLYDSKNA